MQANKRNEFVISKAFRNFLGASILTSVAAQLAVTTDAIVVGHLVGPDAISAINVAMPVNMLFSCASILIGLGASIIGARAIGSHDKEKINHTFSVALLLLLAAGTAVSLITGLSSDGIMRLLCNDNRIYPLATEYISIIAGGAIFLIMSNGINYFVSTDGAPGLVAKGVVAGAAANVILDIVLVHLIGIAGSAWATVINYAITLAIVSTHFMKKSSSYRLVNPFKGFARQAADNIYEGLPLMLGNLLLGLAVIAINRMILKAAGADGLYTWSICLQILMITFVVLNGVGNAMLSIGGILVGEKDYSGVRILTSLSLKLVCNVLTLFVAAVLLFPEFLSFMFGNSAENGIPGVDNALRIFSLLLIPFAVTLTMRFLFQILEHRILSLVMSAGQLIFIIACLWVFIETAPEQLWWSFPFSAVMLIAIQAATTFALWLRKREVSPITLIPRKNSHSIDFSVPYNKECIKKAIEEIKDFLAGHKADAEMKERHIACLQDTISRLYKKCAKERSCFDIHVSKKKNGIKATLRAVGKRIAINEPRNHTTANIEYKYMYGQNVIFVEEADKIK